MGRLQGRGTQEGSGRLKSDTPRLLDQERGAQSTLVTPSSQHLKVLQDAGLVSARPLGNRRLYSVEREGLRELRDYLESFWSDVLDAYNAEVVRRINSEE